MKTFKFQIEWSVQDCHFHYIEAKGPKGAEYKFKQFVKKTYGEWVLERATITLDCGYNHLGAEYLTEYDHLNDLFNKKEQELDFARDRKARLQLELDQLNDEIWNLKEEVETVENDRDNLQIKKAGEK